MSNRPRLASTRRRLAPYVLVAALAATLFAPAGATADTPPAGPHYTWSKEPSKVWLQRPDDTFFRVAPWTYCWAYPPPNDVVACADGVAPERDDLRRLTSGRAARFWFGRPDWEFSASISSLNAPDDESCQQQTDAQRRRPRWFQLPRPERPGVYRVELFGQGPEGDVAATFKWRVGRWDSADAC